MEPTPTHSSTPYPITYQVRLVWFSVTLKDAQNNSKKIIIIYPKGPKKEKHTHMQQKKKLDRLGTNKNNYT